MEDAEHHVPVLLGLWQRWGDHIQTNYNMPYAPLPSNTALRSN